MKKIISYTLFSLFFLTFTLLVGNHFHDVETLKLEKHECAVCLQNRTVQIDNQSFTATQFDLQIKTLHYFFQSYFHQTFIEKKSIILPRSNAPPYSLV